MIIMLREKTSRKMFMLTFFPGLKPGCLELCYILQRGCLLQGIKGRKVTFLFFAAKISPPCEGLSDVRASNGLHRAYNFR